jgi:hypothetical protein
MAMVILREGLAGHRRRPHPRPNQAEAAPFQAAGQFERVIARTDISAFSTRRGAALMLVKDGQCRIESFS